MTSEEYLKNKEEINRQLKEGLIKQKKIEENRINERTETNKQKSKLLDTQNKRKKIQIILITCVIATVIPVKISLRICVLFSINQFFCA